MSATPSHFNLYKRGDVWHITWLLNGKRRWKSTGAVTKRDALQALTRFQELLETTPHPVLVSKFVNDFLGVCLTNPAQRFERPVKDAYQGQVFL